MKYQFPVIRTIDDVLPHIEGREEFSVTDKGAYIVINYNLLTNDTFRPFTGEDDLGNAIRRECRGLIFDAVTRQIIRRPLHKFFNIGEREETLAENVDLDQPHIILDKLDGSMICTFITSDNMLRWGTKAGETDTSEQVLPFIDVNEKYFKLAKHFLEWQITPIFEWMCNDNRIVIDYGQPQLVLIAARDMVTGTYMSYSSLIHHAEAYDIPVVQPFNDVYPNADAMVKNISKMTDVEGFVMRFDDGHMVKIKTDQYIALHKAKEKLLYERYVADMIVNDTIDDVIAHLPPLDAVRVNEYRKHFVKWFYQLAAGCAHVSHRVIAVEQFDRKRFAIEKSAFFGPFASIIFTNFDRIATMSLVEWEQEFEALLRKKISEQTASNSKWDSFKKAAQAPEELKW